MQAKRKQNITFSHGEIHVLIDVSGDLFGSDAVGYVLDELMGWTSGAIHDTLVPHLSDLVRDLDFLEGESVTDSAVRLVIDMNCFDLAVEVTMASRVPQKAVQAIIHRSITGEAVAQFTDIVAAKLAEGSLPNDARFRVLTPA